MEGFVERLDKNLRLEDLCVLGWLPRPMAKYLRVGQFGSGTEDLGPLVSPDPLD